MNESYNNILLSADSQLNIGITLNETTFSEYNGAVLVTYNNDLEIIISLSGNVINDSVVSNLALNKAVFTETEQIGNPATNAVDGNPDSRWSANNFPQSLMIDLGDLFTITSTEVVSYRDRAYQYIIETATNLDENYSLLVDRTQNTTPGTNNNPIIDGFEETTARYIKISVMDLSLIHI